ncbi:Protein kinase domain-containing protein [Entamoeba marina]
MSLPQDSPLTIGLKFENDLGKFEVDQIKDLKSKINLGKLEFGHILDLEFTITCPISKVKVICEQETNTQEKEVETIPVTFQNASTEPKKNLKIHFKVNRGGNVTLVFKVEKLKSNKTHTEEDLKTLEQRVELKYQTKLTNIDVIPENKINFLEEIGEGGEATIKKAIYEGEVVAIKTCIPGFGMEESKNLLYFRNKYIVEYKKSFYREINNQKHFCLMLEYAEHGCLEDVKNRIEQPILYKIMEDVCNAIQYLHQVKNVIHRDIKPQNILIFNYQEICDVNAKLTDFGKCDMIDSDGNLGKVGTDYFMAPEVVKGEKYTNKCDIYSLGITLLSSLLNINFENDDNRNQFIAGVEQNNGTCIKTLANLKSDIRHLIIDCCQIDPSKRPNIKECLNRIQEISKNLGDKDIFGSTNGQINVLFALPKFNLLESVKIVVKSIKELEVTDDFIKKKLMLNFGIDTEDAFALLNENQTSSKNEGDNDYATACYYLKTKKDELMMVGYDLMVTAASKLQPDAIMYLINVLMDIDKGELKMYDYEKFQVNKIINDLYDLNKQIYRTFFIFKPPTLKLNYHKTIPVSIVMDIFSVLKKYFPICEFQYGIALLHGVGIRKSIGDAEKIFNNPKQSEFWKNEVEVQFYQAYCQCLKNNTQDIYKKAYDVLEKLEKSNSSEKQHCISSYATNNKGVLLFKGLGCEKDINKAFEQFGKSMKLNNDYGKFNYAFCLTEHKQTPPPTTNEDGIEIIRNLAKSGFVEAQQFCEIAPIRDSPYLGMHGISNVFQYLKNIRDLLYWLTQASLQLNYHSIIGYFRAQFELIKCYKLGKGTQKNLTEAKNWCIKALDCNENEDENVVETLKTSVFVLYLEIINEIDPCMEDIEKAKDFLFFVKKIRYIGRIIPRYELLMHYYECITEKKDKKAFEYLEEAAKLDSGWACYELGRNYFECRHGVEKDDEKAFYYFEKAVKELSINGSAHYYLGIMYLNGSGVEKDEKKAIEHLIFATKHRGKRAVECLEGLSQNTLDLKVICELGKIYLKGDCVPKDVNKALEYFKRAVNQNHKEGFYQLGKIYKSGIYLKQNIKKAIDCFEKAANQNHAKACYQLGITCIEKDMLRIIKDPKKAIDYFERAANLDYEKALYQLSEMYLYGESGVKKDEEKAFQYLEKAAKMPKKHCDNENLWL